MNYVCVHAFVVKCNYQCILGDRDKLYFSDEVRRVLLNVCCSSTNGWRKKSTYSEILSTGHPFAEIMGLVFVGGFEWTLFSR